MPASGPSRRSSANPWRPNTELKRFVPRDGRRELDISTDLLGTVRPAGRRSQPTGLYYNVLTRSLCLTNPPFSSIAMEKRCRCMYFDICTNAPLWKRKWNLDISGINAQVVSLFEHQRYQTKHHLMAIPTHDTSTAFKTAVTSVTHYDFRLTVDLVLKFKRQ